MLHAFFVNNVIFFFSLLLWFRSPLCVFCHAFKLRLQLRDEVLYCSKMLLLLLKLWLRIAMPLLRPQNLLYCRPQFKTMILVVWWNFIVFVFTLCWWYVTVILNMKFYCLFLALLEKWCFQGFYWIKASFFALLCLCFQLGFFYEESLTVFSRIHIWGTRGS